MVCDVHTSPFALRLIRRSLEPERLRNTGKEARSRVERNVSALLHAVDEGVDNIITSDENHSLARVAMRPRILRRVTVVLKAMEEDEWNRNG